MLTAWIGSACLMVIIPFQILLTLGFPLGEFSLGGRHKVLPVKLRYVSALSVVVLLLMVILLLSLGGIIPLVSSSKTLKYAGYIVCGYFILNTVINFLSESPKEKYTMTPLSAIIAFCFYYTTHYSIL